MLLAGPRICLSVSARFSIHCQTLSVSSTGTTRCSRSVQSLSRVMATARIEAEDDRHHDDAAGFYDFEHSRASIPVSKAARMILHAHGPPNHRVTAPARSGGVAAARVCGLSHDARAELELDGAAVRRRQHFGTRRPASASTIFWRGNPQRLRYPADTMAQPGAVPQRRRSRSTTSDCRDVARRRRRPRGTALPSSARSPSALDVAGQQQASAAGADEQHARPVVVAGTAARGSRFSHSKLDAVPRPGHRAGSASHDGAAIASRHWLGHACHRQSPGSAIARHPRDRLSSWLTTSCIDGSQAARAAETAARRVARYRCRCGSADPCRTTSSVMSGLDHDGEPLSDIEHRDLRLTRLRTRRMPETDADERAQSRRRLACSRSGASMPMTPIDQQQPSPRRRQRATVQRLPAADGRHSESSARSYSMSHAGRLQRISAPTGSTHDGHGRAEQHQRHDHERVQRNRDEVDGSGHQ